ncbi:hypothetical protein KUTeg_015848 [Tegillarca granosa]|uniref:RRM domain-containing protein n=1 Tax=Tegillarca granosa TaxID=220873 RepID=A0ABQ9EJ46_TEGGR|nr:hypothetical protein KUTeg_015848 [Tegillarca granosa]
MDGLQDQSFEDRRSFRKRSNLDYMMPGTKRPSEDLMSNSPMVTNGTGHSPVQNSDNEAKKAKLDQSQISGPSRVVHIRSLPPDVSESDVVQLGIPFGKMTNVLLLKQKNQTTPAQVHLKSVYVQFSNHKELKTDQAHAFQNATAQAALQAAQAVMHGNGEEVRTKTTLRVIVENMVYPVTIEVLYQSLDQQNIYNGCCTLKIDYSKLSNLNVKFNNDKSRDFTNPNLPSGDPGMDQGMPYGAPGFPAAGIPAQVPQMANFGMPNAVGAARMGVYGDVHRVKILFNKKDNALVQMAEPHQAQLAIAHLDKDAGLTKDFTNSPLHRFKRPGSKNCQNIFPPSAVLHLSNIPPNISEDFLTDAFAEHGVVKAFKFFPKDRKMALIQMGSVDEAVNSLIAMHNYPLSDTNHLRVSFSKSTI